MEGLVNYTALLILESLVRIIWVEKELKQNWSLSQQTEKPAPHSRDI